jgi:hypothetical protein
VVVLLEDEAWGCAVACLARTGNVGGATGSHGGGDGGAEVASNVPLSTLPAADKSRALPACDSSRT